MAKGILVTFEGIEGSGKSTQLKLLSEALKKKGEDVVVVREPGGTRIGDRIRDILLNKRLKEMTPLTELFLFAASRAQLTKEVFIPSLQRGAIVLSDRYLDSSIAYQGGGRGLDIELIERINEIATSSIMPDLTFLLDISPESGVKRISERLRKDGTSLLDRFEVEIIDFHRKIREAYLSLCRKYPERIVIIDAERDFEVIFDEIFNRVERLLREKR